MVLEVVCNHLCLSSIEWKLLCLGCGVKEETDVISKVKIRHGYVNVNPRSTSSEGQVEYNDEKELRGAYHPAQWSISLTLASSLTVFVEGGHNKRPPVAQITLGFQKFDGAPSLTAATQIKSALYLFANFLVYCSFCVLILMQMDLLLHLESTGLFLFFVYHGIIL